MLLLSTNNLVGDKIETKVMDEQKAKAVVIFSLT